MNKNTKALTRIVRELRSLESDTVRQASRMAGEEVPTLEIRIAVDSMRDAAQRLEDVIFTVRKGRDDD